jgi:Flp pilus assembly protein TadD
MKNIGRVAGKAVRGFKGAVKVLYKKAEALERYYKRLQKENKEGRAGSTEMREHLFEEAKSYIEKEAYNGAEQRLIELLSLDPKNAKVYEVLGNVYVKTKQYEQAKQTFEYASALRPDDASVLTSLGELAMRDGQIKEAVDFFGRAVDLKPGNPKYLDYLIDAAILSGDRKNAKKGLALLKKANPDNKKIDEFEARVNELPL